MRPFCLILSTLAIAGPVLSAETDSASGSNEMEGLHQFEITADPAHLWRLWKGWQEQSKNAVPVHQPSGMANEAVDGRILTAFRALAAIDKQRRLLDTESAKLRVELDGFLSESKKRTDQPFVTIGITPPSAIPDLQYRQRYVDFLAARKRDLEIADKAMSLGQLTEYFTTMTDSAINALAPKARLKLLESVRAIRGLPSQVLTKLQTQILAPKAVP